MVNRDTDINQKAKRVITISSKLRHVPHAEWDKNEVSKNAAPLYYSTSRLTNVKGIESLSSSGLINVIRRRMDMEIPQMRQDDKDYSGCIMSYFNHYKDKGMVKYFPGMKLKTGDLLIWKYRNANSKGHMAIYEKTSKKATGTEQHEAIWHSVPHAGVTNSPFQNTVSVLGDKFFVVPKHVWLSKN
jgi:hypothetical protein